MLFFKFGIALLAPLASLAVPVRYGSQSRPQNVIAISGQTMPLPPTTRIDLPSSASHYRRQIGGSLSFVTNPDPTDVGLFADVISLVPAPTGLTSEQLNPGSCNRGGFKYLFYRPAA
ncbi:hypothetical protein BGW80DRAFT_1255102 [Lactifluus volemus]|nr:hypothetical protein BGW80DRAFT_1255102 [Lactifluus volemus]